MSEGFRGVPGVPDGWVFLGFYQIVDDQWTFDDDGRPFQWSGGKRTGLYPIIRKIEQPARYRPFANAEEFKPHRDRWWQVKGNATCYPPGHYKDAGYNGSTWRQVFDDLIFDDGTPFGVKIDE